MGSDIANLVKAQREFFLSGKTLEVDFRVEALKKLKVAVQRHEEDFSKALYQDLRKSKLESYMSETGMVLDEIGYELKHIRRWTKTKRVKTPIAQFLAKSFVVPEPYGVVLIMAPWNYPVQLCLEPLIGAIAAGNTAIIKPSAYAPAVSSCIASLISEIFEPSFVAVVEGGREENTQLLEQKFDYIFFTGSSKVGKLVMEKASKNLTPVSLELGGKSPVIVDHTANLALAAKRLAFGKYLNAGQTCVAPD
jgi:aldehyde dehydrogenase (NAD+)